MFKAIVTALTLLTALSSHATLLDGKCSTLSDNEIQRIWAAGPRTTERAEAACRRQLMARFKLFEDQAHGDENVATDMINADQDVANIEHALDMLGIPAAIN